MKGWTWVRVVALNKLICEASGQVHAIRAEPLWAKDTEIVYVAPNEIAENHYFIEGNKRTACCLAICQTLKGV